MEGGGGGDSHGSYVKYCKSKSSASANVWLEHYNSLSSKKKKQNSWFFYKHTKRLLGFVSFLGSKRCCIFVPIDRVTVCAFVC